MNRSKVNSETWDQRYWSARKAIMESWTFLKAALNVHFRIGFFCCIETGFHDILRKRPELGSRSHQFFQGFWVAGVIFCLHVDVRGLGGGLDDGLVGW